MKGWLDNFGKANNANDSKVSMSEDFVGLGYNTKGRNYSPAWGGQFEYGGEIAQDGKLLPVSPTQQIQQAVEQTPTVPYLQTKDPSEFYKSWIQSPEYARRQLLTGYSSGEDLYMPNAAASRESRLGAIEEMTPITYSTRQPSEAKPGVYGSPSYVNINPSDYIDTSKEAIQAHELAHIAGAMGEVRPGMMSAKEQEIFKKSMLPMKEPVLSGVQGSKEREASKRALEDWKHSQEPDEAKADLDALRFMMYDKGIYDITKGKKFTETDFEKAKQNLGKDRVFKRLENRMGKNNFVNLMNTIAKADDQEEAPIAMGGMSIPGSVGFSYARVAGAAPSKGKYAKKTMASAQKGDDIKKDATDIAASDKIAQLQLLESPEYQYRKYLESLPQLRQAPGRGEELMRQGLGYADVATDVMQLGNFIPNPIAQTVGKVGNVTGMIVDGLQGATDAYKGNYLNAGINLGSVALPLFLGSNTFRRNAMNLRPGDPLYSLTQKAGKPYTIDLNKTDTDYLELFSKVKGMKDKSLMYNRAFLGALGGETAYDAGLIGPVKKEYGGDIPSAQNGIMSPMLLARNVLNYFYPSKEAAPTVTAAPVNYKKGLTNELLQRQAYKESTFNPAAVSPAGYKGLTQIGESVLKDYSKKKGGKKLDPFNPEDAVELQKFAMDDLYNASFINKPEQSDSVRLAKTLAAYNWGRGNLSNYLNEQKSKGVDIYDSYDWLNNLPKETSDYVNKILLQEDPSFNKNYKKASTNPKYEDITSLYDQKKFGGDIPSAQNGQEMRFYQNGLDWKPKSMQPGGNIERVSINDPRYPELYKNRQVGAYYDGAYSLPDLDEVTVTAPRSYTMDSLRDFTTAALYGAPANAMKLSMIPQAAMTEGIEALRGEPYDFSNVNPNFGEFTSNQRDLSQTMGYENPEGFLENAANIGLSMIDPAILIGGKGALRQPVKQGLKKVDIQKSGFPNPLRVIDSVIPRPLAPGNLFGLEDSWNNYSPLNLIPGYGKRLVDESSSYPDFVGFRKFGNSIDDVIESQSLRPRGSGMGSQQTRLEGNWAESGRVNENYPGVFEATMNPKVPGSNIQLQKVPRRSGILGTTKEGNVEIPLTDPGLSFNRRLPFSNRYIPIDKDKLINDEFQMSTLAPSLQSLAEKYAIWSGLGAGAGALGYSQLSDANEKYIIDPAVEKYKNLDERLNKMFGISNKKNGGIVKDNQGYWNPDNWGQPVEIDSNDITMEGVYEPLLGVSDTGDTKLMKPGKNYKFKGKKVTEFPVAELGINQLDAQPMKKLNQLLNFTNNPDKDNWLDKYN